MSVESLRSFFIHYQREREREKYFFSNQESEKEVFLFKEVMDIV